MTYYNTNSEEGPELIKSRMNTVKQETTIYLLFEDDSYLSPDMIDELLYNDYPITSIRRALTNLTDQGLLEKTDKMVMGKYGKKTHTWKLAESED